MKWIHLTHEYYSCVDDEDYEEVSKYLWNRSKSNYGLCSQMAGVPIHIFLMGKNPGKEVDHINRAEWDNRRQNLRVVDKWVNLKNKGIPESPPFPTIQEKIDAKKQRESLKNDKSRQGCKAIAQKNQWSSGKFDYKKKEVVDDLGNIFHSVMEAARFVDAKNPSSISRCCLGKVKTAYGRTWKYL